MSALHSIFADLTTSLLAAREASFPPRIDVGLALRQFTGLNAGTAETIGRIGNAFTTAAYGRSGSTYAAMTAADFDVLERFVEHLRSEIALLHVRAPEEPADKVATLHGYSAHSDDQEHF